MASALAHTPAKMAVAAAGAALVCAAAVPAISDWAGPGSRSAGYGQAAALSLPNQRPGSAAHASQPGSAFAPRTTRVGGQSVSASRSASRSAVNSPVSHAAMRHRAATSGAARAGAAKPTVSTAYHNPLRTISGLIPERVDQGVDFGGSGSIYALGDGVVTQACGTCYGWPGGGWITYRLTDGPAAGLMVFVAEDVRPTVSVGQSVTSSTVIATMFVGGDGIETGWAMASTYTAESQLPEAGGISGAGPFPTVIGMNFEELLQALGVPAANNRSATTYGILPAGYSPDWAIALKLQP